MLFRFLKACIMVKCCASVVREFQQSTERWRNDDSNCLLAKRGFWMKGVGRRGETGGKWNVKNVSLMIVQNFIIKYSVERWKRLSKSNPCWLYFSWTIGAHLYASGACCLLYNNQLYRSHSSGSPPCYFFRHCSKRPTYSLGVNECR